MGRTKDARPQGRRNNVSIGYKGAGRVRAGAHSAKQVERRLERQADERVAQALAEAAEERRRLDRLIARQEQQPALGATLGAQYVQEQEALEAEPEPLPPVEPVVVPKPRPKPPESHFEYEPDEGIPRPPWTVEDCRQMLRDGYTMDSVMARTGVGHRWIKDLPVDSEGYWTG